MAKSVERSSTAPAGNKGENEILSFSSPHTVQTLDQIPIPLLKLLVVLGPTLQCTSQLIDILMWRTSQPRQSVLMVLLWIMSCLWTWQLLAFGLPMLILYKLGRDWLSVKTSKSRREAMEKARAEQRQRREEKIKRDRYHDEEDDEVTRLQQQKEEEDELISRKIRPEGQVSLDDTLQDLAVVNSFIDHVVLNLKRVWIHLDGSKSDTVISVLSILLYTWPIWIVLNWMLGAHMILAIVGTVLLISPSPWFNTIVFAMRRNIILKHVLAATWAYGVALITTTLGHFSWPQKSVKKTTLVKNWLYSVLSRAKSEKSRALQVIETDADSDASTGKRNEMIFQFEVFENQRWWLGVNWTTNMMPSERSPWTDNQLKPIPAKEEFKLPESTVKTSTHTVNNEIIKRTTNKVWSWADGDWWVDMTGELAGKIDHNGWEYGNNAWKQMSGLPGIQTFTRRRRWCRRARLVEREIDQVETKEDA
ncbi:Peroxin/Dysferlin domain-containing protein [Mucor mucedo]|uniref:Peroxin/Dysferlin domain-containing protein n=1 Tax=Mucor mucedo TaxID=29922 RepID=UPI002220CD35|nr:Peroxin/Dysferlin domain-containing protein [Mucor mucedo]KAI7891511.1 Peroxin/Dysferlin domain-containing protein [Mucor mucedo]